MCGKGKTTWAMQYINQHRDRQYIYITPFLSEVDRVWKDTHVGLLQPDNKGQSKIDDFNKLLYKGHSIVSTHATFANATDETLTYIQQGHYTLFLDEAMDVIRPYNEAVETQAIGRTKNEQGIGKGDIHLLTEHGYITTDEYDRVKWIGPSYAEEGWKYATFERTAKRGNLIWVDGSCLFWEFPPEFFKAFDEVYILTYMFEGSLLAPYFQYHGIEYSKMNVCCKDGKYDIKPYEWDDADTDVYKALIELYNNKKANDFDKHMLSSNWYERNVTKNSGGAARIKNAITNYCYNAHRAKAQRIMWTCPKKYEAILKDKGRTTTHRLTRAEKDGKTPQEIVEMERRYSCFVPCNARATNDFRARDVLAYCCNLYPNPYLVSFFAKKEIAINQDVFALSNLIQWIWRSAIRDGKPIKLYIPSTRMRGLFTGWLNQVKQSETPAPEPVPDPELDSDYLESLLNDNDM
jgi:hypothetical protein